MKKERIEEIRKILQGYLNRMEEIRERAEKDDIDEKDFRELKEIMKRVLKIYGEVVGESFGIVVN